MLAIATNSTDVVCNKLDKDILINMIINQKKSYSDISDYCLSLLTPLEKDFLKNVLDFKGCYISNLAQVDNGKYITLFLPEFAVKSYTRQHICYHNEFTFKRQDGRLEVKTYSFGFPRVVEFCDYYNQHSISDYIGCHNGYGWEIIRARKVEEIHCYQEVLY